MQNGKIIDVCFSPALLHLYALEEKVVVVIDVLRATSSICTALHAGAERVIVVATLEEAMYYQQNGYLVGAERDGKPVEGFSFGNSPLEYLNGNIKGKKIVLTTTNGTRAITMAKKAHRIAIGSFLNLDALCEWLKQQNKEILLLCAGWKDKFNLEDSLLAGAVVHQLQNYFTLGSDAALAAKHLYACTHHNLLTILKNSSHYQRLVYQKAEKDIVFCFTPNQTKVVPVWTEAGIQ